MRVMPDDPIVLVIGVMPIIPIVGVRAVARRTGPHHRYDPANPP
jgi:hypothetical protein